MKPSKPMPATAIERDLARTLRQKISEFDEVVQGACWRNSLLVMALMPDDPDIVYVEGWLLSAEHNFPYEHGWIEVKGVVVDVTLESKEGDLYCGVFRYSVGEVIPQMHRRDTQPFYAHSKRGRRAMLDSFLELPIDFNMAIALGRLALHYTGIEQIYVSREGQEYLQPKLDARWREQRKAQQGVMNGVVS